MVKERAGLNDISDTSVFFQHRTFKYVIQITDEGDEKHLQNIVHQVSTHVRLFVVDIDLVEETQHA